MSHELATLEQHSNLPMTKEQVVAQTSLVRQVMESVMKSDTHYGVIPGCKQPTLFKAGSEKILSTFRISVIPTVEDLSTHDCFRYRVTCQGVLPSGEIVGAGIGEASTDEEKYRWRGAVCDEEFDATPEDLRRIKWAKGWNNAPAKSTKQVRTNASDLANTVLKMAKKRAQIDLTLTCTACSDVFVQDLEDLSEELRDELVNADAPKQRQGKPEVSQPQSKQQSTSTSAAASTQDNGDKATDGQVKMLHVKLKQGNVSEADFKAHYQIESISDLPKSMVNAAIKAIGEGAIKPAGSTEQVSGSIVCEDCGMPMVEGACRNSSCPEGKPFEAV